MARNKANDIFPKIIGLVDVAGGNFEDMEMGRGDVRTVEKGL